MTSLAEVLKDGVFADGDWVESKDQDPNGDVRLLQLADVGDGTFINKSSRFLTSERARALRCTFLEAGDILVARMPDPIGRACIFPGLAQPCVTVVDVCIVRAGANAERRWLLHAINSPDFRKQIERHIKGTTRQRISRTNLGTLDLKLPSLPEQRRIADILDKADAIRRKRKEAIALTEELLRSTFLEMFGDPVTNPKGWPVKALGEVVDLFAGNSLPSGVPFAGQHGGYLLMKVGDMNIAGNEVTISTAREWSENVPTATIVAPAGAVVIPKRGGAIATNKKRVLTRAAALDPNLMAIAPRPALQLDYLRQWFEGIDLATLSNGSAVPQLNKKDLTPLIVPVPSAKQQDAFVQCANRIRSIRTHADGALEDADALFSTLVARAFSGNLAA